MKKAIMILLTLALILSLAGCRPAVDPAAEGGAAASAGGTDAKGVSDTEIEQQAEEDREAEEANEKARKEAEEKDAEAVKKQQETASKNRAEALQKTEEDIEKAKDPSYSAAAAKEKWREILKEYPDAEERYRYCAKNDIKMFSDAEQLDRILADTEKYFPGEVSVVLLRKFSIPFRAAPDFSCVEAETVKDPDLGYKDSPVWDPGEDYRQSFTIVLKNKEPKAMKEAILKLEELEYVFTAEPNVAISFA